MQRIPPRPVTAGTPLGHRTLAAIAASTMLALFSALWRGLFP